jgi:hypothetical protein
VEEALAAAAGLLDSDFDSDFGADSVLPEVLVVDVDPAPFAEPFPFARLSVR